LRALAAGALALCALLPGASAAQCPAAGAVVAVDTRAHRLHLCRDGREERSFAVAIGSGGAGKRLAGDKKTPLGTYGLGAPRPSKQFGTFVPVAYPTTAQRANGFTGGDIGVHGPKRGFRFLGSLNVKIDWTLGCIAVASDDEIAAIAAWVRAAPGATIALE
jgi:murein L,D-transpeptidase YafK